MSADLTVTDHAVIRYIERVLGIDCAPIRERIASDRLRQAHAVLGDGRYGIGSGHVAVVVEGRVVTVRPAHPVRHHRGPRR